MGSHKLAADSQVTEVASPSSSDDAAELPDRPKSANESLPGFETPPDYDSDAEWARLRHEVKQLRSTRTATMNPEQQLIEERLRWIERKLRKLDMKKDHRNEDNVKKASDADKLTPDDKADSKDADEFYKANARQMGVIAEFRRVDWYNFKNHKIDEKQYAVEVLAGKARYYHQNHRFYNSEGRTRTPWDEVLSEPESSNDQDRQPREAPERIRINSLAIIQMLDDLEPYSWQLKPTLMLRPFKTLVHWESALREKLTQLEVRWGDAAKHPGHQFKEETASIEREGEGRAVSLGLVTKATKEPFKAREDTVESEIRTDSIDAYQELRCLIQWYDQDIKPLVEYYRTDGIRTISFSNLWYLFKPGDMIRRPLDRTSQNSGSSVTARAGLSDSGSAKSGDKSSRATVSQRYQTTYRCSRSHYGRPVLSPRESDNYGMSPRRPLNAFELEIYYVDYDGTAFEPWYTTGAIQPFEGEVEITSLALYPAMYDPSWIVEQQQLVARGKIFRRFVEPLHLMYTGPSLACPPGGKTIAIDKDHWILPRAENTDSEVIIDFRETLREHPNWLRTDDNVADNSETANSEYHEDARVPLQLWSSSDDRKPKFEIVEKADKDTTVEEWREASFEKENPFLFSYHNSPVGSRSHIDSFSKEEFALLPDRAFAFVLRKREFAQIHVDERYLYEIEAPKDGFNNLKLKKGHKQMVQSLVQTHFETKTRAAENPHRRRERDFDVVRGKGRGLIILLHGAPGTGKTSTAECVAESNGKPLLSIVCGDLGMTPEKVEASLNVRFRQAEHWDCVLLLDEADVFLASRDRHDLKRNSLVAVFLRILEYYTGILFLTTNRVGTFDEAFRSRIHMWLYYPPLDKLQTLAIWQMNLQRLHERRPGKIKADWDELKKFAEWHFDSNEPNDSCWNGRQIRNAFQTAVALAEYDTNVQHLKDGVSTRESVVDLAVKYFNKVANASKDFDRYLTKTVGNRTAADLARGKQERMDHMDTREDLGGYASLRAERPAVWPRDSDPQLSQRAPQPYAGYQQAPTSPPPSMPPSRAGEPYAYGFSSSPVPYRGENSRRDTEGHARQRPAGTFADQASSGFRASPVAERPGSSRGAMEDVGRTRDLDDGGYGGTGRARSIGYRPEDDDDDDYD